MVFPVELNKLDEKRLGIQWNDGHRSTYHVRNLRLECKCAVCVDEWTREKLLKDENVPADIRPSKIESVGRYALNFKWSDGHDAGIYTFDHLRNLCECTECRKA
ncbi:MAG: DUF971 domain-containing protein [Bdellovibrionales bacterium]|nr:DUF971 domain-containing protein [Bdellovibrionales bacterium]